MSDRNSTQAPGRAEKAGQAGKQSFLQGAAVLTIGAILVKLIGALFKIPINRIIGTEGFGHFNVAYSVYNVLLTIASTGLPVAVSRMISESSTLGNRRQVQRIYQLSLRLFLGIGIVLSALMLIFAKQLASFMRDPDAVYAIAALAPAVLFVCILCTFRGYFQGQQNMTSTSVSQVIEALGKLIIGLGAVIIITRMGLGNAKAAGGAILGVTIGTVLAAIYLIWVYRKQHIRLTAEEQLQPVKSSSETLKQLIQLALPITISSAGLQIFNALDTMIIEARLQDALGLSSAAATSLFGTYSAAQTFYMLPPALISPLAISIIPSVTAAITLKHHREVQKLEESAFRMTALLGLPCAAGLAVLASPIQEWLYAYDAETVAVAGPTLALLGIAVIFNCMTIVTNAILQAHQHVKVLVWTTLAGGIVNITTDYFLIGIPSIGIYGAAIATIAYCAVITLLNVLVMHRRLEQPPRILRQFVKPMVATAVMSVVAYLVYEAVRHSLGRVSLAVIASVACAGIAYVILVYLLKIITWDDCQLLPKSATIARLLRVSKPEDE